MNRKDLEKLSKKELVELSAQLSQDVEVETEDDQFDIDSPLPESGFQDDISKDFNSKDFGDPEIEADNSRWELDPNDVFVSIEHNLRSEKLSRDGTKWIKVPGTDPLMNERGISRVMQLLRSFINKNNALGAIDSKHAHKITAAASRSIVDVLKYEYKSWNVKKPYLGYVINIIEWPVYMFLTRAIGAGERKARKKYGYNEQYSHDEVSPDEIRSKKTLNL